MDFDEFMFLSSFYRTSYCKSSNVCIFNLNNFSVINEQKLFTDCKFVTHFSTNHSISHFFFFFLIASRRNYGDLTEKSNVSKCSDVIFSTVKQFLIPFIKKNKNNNRDCYCSDYCRTYITYIILDKSAQENINKVIILSRTGSDYLYTKISNKLDFRLVTQSLL